MRAQRMWLSKASKCTCKAQLMLIIAFIPIFLYTIHCLQFRRKFYIVLHCTEKPCSVSIMKDMVHDSMATDVTFHYSSGYKTQLLKVGLVH